MVNRLEATLSATSSTIAKIFHHTITSSERRTVNQYLIDAERALKEYEVDIERHKAAILVLEGKHSQLKKKVDKYRSLLSPVHRIPPEVLARIFHACDRHDVPMVFQPTLMTITEVCRRWRDVALSAPYLWSSFISFDFDTWIDEHNTLDPLDRIIPLLLMRTQACPLNVHLDFTYLEEEQISTCIALCKDVFATSHRWRHATIGITPRSYRQPAFEVIRGQLPQLHSLNLILGDWHTTESFGHLDIFRTCPSLYSFKLRINKNLHHFPDNILLPYPQLRNIVFEAFNIQNLLPCLSTTFSHAVRLDIKDFVPSSTTGASHVLRSVQHLRLSSTKQQDQSNFIFGLATLPHLLTLEVNGISSLWLESPSTLANPLWRTFDEKLVVEFMQRSACNLTSLTLKYIPATDFQTITLLHLIPTLTHLHIEEVRQLYNNNGKDFNNRILTTMFFHHLIIDDENASDTSTPPFLPRLTELVLAASRFNLDQNALLDAITSRYQHDSGNEFASLRSLSLKVFCRGGEPELPPLRCFTSLKYFQATGLLLKLTPDDWEA